MPHEPRRALPLALIEAMAETVDPDAFDEVQFMFFLVVLLFTFSRSECPCPKNFTGAESWDDDQHWMVRDLKICWVSSKWVLAVRFKKIKQDPRIERPAARGDGTDRGASQRGGSDWAYVGDAPDSILSPFKWYRMLMQFYSGPREETEPFFMARDRVRPYTYSAAMADLKAMLSRVTSDLDYGLHGARVEGYNRAKKACGEDAAVAQGGWKPGSNSRYDRFDLARDIFPMAARMVSSTAGQEREDVGGDVDEGEGSGADEVPVRVISRARLVRHSAVQQPASEQPAAAQPVAMPSPPPRGGVTCPLLAVW